MDKNKLYSYIVKKLVNRFMAHYISNGTQKGIIFSFTPSSDTYSTDGSDDELDQCVVTRGHSPNCQITPKQQQMFSDTEYSPTTSDDELTDREVRQRLSFDHIVNQNGTQTRPRMLNAPALIDDATSHSSLPDAQSYTKPSSKTVLSCIIAGLLVTFFVCTQKAWSSTIGFFGPKNKPSRKI